MENRKVKKSARCNGKRSVQLADFLFCAMLNLCTIGTLLCERSFDNSAVTFLPTAEIYLAPQFSSGTFSRLYARHESRESPWYKGRFGHRKSPPQFYQNYGGLLAESKGFEPSKRFWRLHDFQSCSFDQLGQLSVSAIKCSSIIYDCA